MIDIEAEVKAVKNTVAKKIRVLEIEKEKIEASIYRLQKMLEGMDSATDLKRIRRVKHELVCGHCGNKFTSGTSTASTCRKAECRAKQAKKTRAKGITLVAGDALSK
jgi:hypothetical protein